MLLWADRRTRGGLARAIFVSALLGAALVGDWAAESRSKAATPIVPPTSRSRLAKPAIDLRSILDQTGAVIRAEVTASSFSYSDENGPRTNVTLDRIETILGERQPASLRLAFF